ncbi:MAG: pyruvate:ferredoxin (flavodoxin) oxidoreductase [Burkholderiales bacterium]|nr:pyruvate:ferredoxin (flavodoxin) oxidoreductase [Burkholderiales bacterium]
MTSQRLAMDGMTAASYAAYALSDTIYIYPITPASHMAETLEKWSVKGKLNLMGHTVEIKEMQSEKGVAGAVHGSLAGGALTTTVTASQGLMLMIPNMYKISGELLPGVFHVTTRSLSAHALSIFGDHQDVMAVRQTGFAMLASASVQECMDLSLVAHLSAISGSLPIVHFFDGYRTSDEIQTIEVIDPEKMRDLVEWHKVDAFRRAAMEPERPNIRGTAQNPDVYFQNREAPNVIYDDFIQHVKDNMAKVEKLTGRSYHPFDYVGHPEADRVAVSMGSSCDCLEEVVNYLNKNGEKVGLIKVRLYRPFSTMDFLNTLPPTAQVVCALDRTKEPGSQGEPLLQDVCTALMAIRKNPIVVGGRYGLSSKEFTPAMALAVFDNMRRKAPFPRFTVGIKDDVSHLSLQVGPWLNTLQPNTYQCIFYGFGSDGMVSASKEVAKIISDVTGKYAQGYYYYDSKKSGSLTISYLRFADRPIHSPYLIKQADYIACAKQIYVKRGYDMVSDLKEGGIFVLNSEWDSLEKMEKELPDYVKRDIAGKKAKFYNINASKLAADLGLGHRLNLIMTVAFLKLSGIADFDKAIAELKDEIKEVYRSKGPKVIADDIKAIDEALGSLQQIQYPTAWVNIVEPQEPSQPVPQFIKKVFEPVEKLDGNELPVSFFNPAGFQPTGTSAYEKRTVAFEIPEWEADKCVQCYQCAFICPHAAIRPYLATDEELKNAPDTYKTIPAKDEPLHGLHFRQQVYPQDCVGCGSCAYNCPAPGKALVMRPLAEQLDTQKQNLQFAQENISIKDEIMTKWTVHGSQLQQPLMQFSGACAGCGETPYVKLLTQLFGDRAIIANATGCSSIWGGYFPSIPYAANKHGHGPAWGNSLFEDNGEYAYGIARGVRIRRNALIDLVQKAVKRTDLDADVIVLMKTWLEVKDDPEAAKSVGHAIRKELTRYESDPLIAEILKNQEMFGCKSVWAVGGDGWAYDIGYGGLDEILASNENINVLVLDTEGYSNTGGELSKATQLGAVTGFSVDGKTTPRKNLGRMFMQYGYVYVASICLEANMQQAIDAFREAEAYNGPSIIIGLCPCITWGLRAGMSTVSGASKEAVATGYWPLYRFNPMLAKEGKDPLIIDSPEPRTNMEEFLAGQDRYASLAERLPKLSARLQSELAKDSDIYYSQISRMKGVFEPKEEESSKQEKPKA